MTTSKPENLFNNNGIDLYEYATYKNNGMCDLPDSWIPSEVRDRLKKIKEHESVIESYKESVQELRDKWDEISDEQKRSWGYEV